MAPAPSPQPRLQHSVDLNHLLAALTDADDPKPCANEFTDASDVVLRRFGELLEPAAVAG